jgi:hypothetical protein
MRQPEEGNGAGYGDGNWIVVFRIELPSRSK